VVTLAVGPECLEIQMPGVTEDRDEALAQFIRLNPDLRVEQEPDGTLTVMAPAGGESSARNGEASRQLANWARRDGTGIVFDSSGGFRLPRTGAMRAPDAAWVRRERWQAVPRGERARFAPLCPDFVLELRSPTDNLDGLLRKMREYQQNGARLGWLLDPTSRRVWAYPEGEAAPSILDDPPMLSGDPVLPGFELDLASVWRAGEVDGA
jgi:Uma2 family endonuclease